MWESILVSAGIGAIITSIKNKDKAATLKESLSHLVQAICTVYGWQVTMDAPVMTVGAVVTGQGGSVEANNG